MKLPLPTVAVFHSYAGRECYHLKPETKLTSSECHLRGPIGVLLGGLLRGLLSDRLEGLLLDLLGHLLGGLLGVQCYGCLEGKEVLGGVAEPTGLPRSPVRAANKILQDSQQIPPQNCNKQSNTDTIAHCPSVVAGPGPFSLKSPRPTWQGSLRKDPRDPTFNLPRARKQCLSNEQATAANPIHAATTEDGGVAKNTGGGGFRTKSNSRW